MNLYKKFKNYIIGEALAQTDDVFEKARIELTYSFTLFFWFLGILFYGNIIAHHLWWQFYIISIGFVMLPLIFVTLKKTKNVRYAGYFFVFNMIVLSSLNQWLYKFELNIIGGFWIMVFLLFVFFVLGKKWGFIIVGYQVLSITVIPINKVLGNSLLSYSIPPEQVPEQLPVFVLMPFSICVYGIFQIINTRNTAEEQISNQKKQLELNNRELEIQKKDIISSINYAKRIQKAKLPKKEEIYSALPQSFVLFKPKDIVSGDFYFFSKSHKQIFIAAADCTGHGVPGAFMSMIGSEKLEDAVSQTADTSEILNLLNKGIKTALHQSENNESTRDGMDIALCSIDLENCMVKYAGANRPIWVIRKGQKEVEEIKATKKAIGGFTEDEQHFDAQEIKLQQGDSFYISTDGYADQFGGEGEKKLMTKKFKEILLAIQDMTMQEQEKYLDNFIENWKEGIEQVDDILVIGVRI